MSKNLGLNWFDWFLILGTTIVSILSSIFGEGWDTIGFIVAATGIINLVLCAKGNILNYIFGIVYNALYVYISYKAGLKADAAIYLCYYLPMQFVGWYRWKNNSNESSGTVQARHLTARWAFILLAIALILIPVFAKILEIPSINDSQPWLDSATTIASVIAMFMMVKAFAEQWYIWLALDILQTSKWTIASIRGDEGAILMLVMFAFFTANAVYGLIGWHRLASRPQDPQLM